MAIMDEISSIKTFFQSHNVQLSSAWLEGCITWCKQEDLPPNYTLKDLQHKVFEQWLLLDLRDVEVPSLPPDLSNKTKYILNGNYSLQMLKVIDISKPKYWQLQRIRNNTFKNVDPENETSKRVLQLTLTDGVKEVEAMEYQPIPCLNLNLSPGIKIRLMGPVTVRRGRLMLESKNVKILGGEVEELIVPNAAENILAKFLNLAVNPTPTVIQESLLTANTEMFNRPGENTVQVRGQNTVQNNTANPFSLSAKAVRQNQPSRPANGLNNTVATTRQTESNTVDAYDEDLRIAEKIDMLMEVERDFEEPPAKRRKSGNKTPDLFDNLDDSVFEHIDIPPSAMETPSEPKKPSTSNEEENQIDMDDLHRSLEQENDFFENFDIDAHLDQVTKESEWKPCTPQKPPILTIEKLQKNLPHISNGKFKIKAKFHSVVEKLTVADGGYHLVVKVEDETGSLTVKIHSDVVSEFAGSYSSTLISLRNENLENNTAARAMVLKTLSNIKDKLITLDNIVEVHVSTKEKFPVIFNIPSKYTVFIIQVQNTTTYYTTPALKFFVPNV